LNLIPIKNIPVSFIRKTLTQHQKEYIAIKFHIKVAMDKWEGTKLALYDQLAKEMPLSVHTIRKLAQQI